MRALFNITKKTSYPFFCRLSLYIYEVKLEGITLLAVDKIGPYVAVEGTGRLASIYMAQQLEHLDLLDNNQLEVTLGIY